MFLIGKAVKYTSWGLFGFFMYHMYLVKSYEKPDEGPLASEPMIRAARMVDWSIKDFQKLLTKPGMTKMLPDRLDIPGQPPMKVLVCNLNGTLVHQTYKLGTGIEVYKRPGLTAFLNRLSRYYEIVIFGMGESGGINEICEVLDPNF